MKRKVKVNLGELAFALDTDFAELPQYLDLEVINWLDYYDIEPIQ